MSTDRTLQLVTGIFLLGMVHTAMSNEAWLNEEYGYFARDESLRSLLYDFAASVAVPAIISSKIEISISGNFPTIRAEDFLTKLAKDHNLSWIYDGTTLHVYTIDEIKQETLNLPYSLAEKFKDYIKEIDIKGVPLNWKMIPTQNVLQVSGPPRFVSLVQEVVGRVKKQSELAIKIQAEKADEYEVRIFHIEYGYVDKAGNQASGNKTPVVSLAEMLGSIMNISHISSVVADGGPQKLTGSSESLPKLRGSGLAAQEESGQEDQQQAASPPPYAATIVGVRKSEAYIIGDPRLNAIIVRDLKSRMPTYERLIKALDKPLDQIEIEVSAFDIDVSEMQNLGFDWVRSLSLTAGNAPESSQDTGGFIYNTTLGRAELSSFIVRLSALQSEGKSRILSRPSVLTLDNHEALFQNNQTFYVRLGAPDDGSQSAAVDLVPISYGVILRVRPHVIYDGDDRKVQLAVHVEDGRRLEAASDVGGLPQVAQNIIQTQAVIREGQSLLIGGYNVRERVLNQRRVPVLGHLPVVGFFFTNTNERDISIARYFVITPRIVDTAINFTIKTGFEDEENETLNVIEEEVIKKPSGNNSQYYTPFGRPHTGAL